ncbi:hypothetical protein Zm00014a_001632 [Zea mays]|uniref:Rhodanese domain-containing protein n=2 Tax=Zea mays TaxID=4577 RepID=A0A3L6EZ10_MAIZE|nr:Thiosulfate sulfurtransferase 18 [Zea mays]PWZ26090.1 hypothetical protein Zm00014a_001632 [Zea mays]
MVNCRASINAKAGHTYSQVRPITGHPSIHPCSNGVCSDQQSQSCLGVHCSDKEQAVPTIDADEAHALLSSGHGYVDVRMRGDFHKAHAPGARNVPYYLSVTPQGKEKNPHFVEEVAAFCGKADVFIVGCNTGNRSRFATADLLNAGFKNVRNLQGGYRSFQQRAQQQ